MNNLSRRTITAVFFVAITTFGTLWSPPSAYLLFFIIAGLCLLEFLQLALNPVEDKARRTFGIIAGMILGLFFNALFFLIKMGWWESFEIGAGDFVLFALIWFALLFVYFAIDLLVFVKKRQVVKAHVVFGVFYLGLPFSLLYFAPVERPNLFIFGLMSMIWVYDTGAYLIGTWAGKRQMIPHISPKKTWEGAIGGAVLTFGIAFVEHRVLGLFSIEDWLALAGIVSVFSPIGDIFESAIKRRFEVKDSGNLLPGHGGFLDRFDSFVFALPFALVYLLCIKENFN